MRRWLDRLVLRLRSLVRGERTDRALRDELRVHIEEQIAEHVAAGMSPAEARTAALREFGPIAAIEEACRDTRRVAIVSNLVRDLRYTLRALGRQPLLVAAATLSIALATAANATIFVLIDQLVIAAPSARDPDRLAYIRFSNGSHVSHPQWRDLDRSGALAGLAGYQVEFEAIWSGPDRSISMMPLAVTANFFDVVGVPVAIGRGFHADEAQAERQPAVTVVSDRFWRTALGSDPAALGRTLVFNGRPYAVVGILAPHIRSVPGLGLSPDVYLPLSVDLMPSLAQRRSSAVQLIGRLHDGQSLAQARAAVEAAARRIDEEQGRKELGTLAQLAGAQDLGLGQVGAFLALVAVVVGLILAIACANVAGLLLSQGTARRRDVAVRAALGATRVRLVQQFLVEAFWIALAGTGAGVLLSFLLLRGIASIELPVPVPFVIDAAPNVRLLIPTAALLAATTVLCGLMPALRSTRVALVPALKRDEPRYGRRRWTLRSFLVIGQVAVAVVLLLTAFLFLRNLARAHDLDPGFDIQHTLVAEISFVEGRHTPATRAALLTDAVARLRSLPGVEHAAYAHAVPLMLRSGLFTGAEIRRDDRPDPFHASYAASFVGPGYFSTMGIPLLRGREFADTDRPGGPAVAIVNEEFVRRHFAGDDPVGRKLFLPGADQLYPAEIVGVVANSKHRTLGEDQYAAVYEAFLQRANRNRFVHLLIRADAATDALARDAERLLLDLDRTAAVTVRPMRSALSFAFLPSRVGAAILGTLGALGLGLAMVGLYATIAYAVARRTTEIGVRVALGATKMAVLRLVVFDAVQLAGIGIALGLSIAFFVTQPLGMFLVSGLETTDPISFVGTALLLLALSLAAAAAPARRALRVDPVKALRAE